MNQRPETPIYDVVLTPMFPCKYQLVRKGNWTRNNSFTEFFKTIDDAVNEIVRRNAEIGDLRHEIKSKS